MVGFFPISSAATFVLIAPPLIDLQPFMAAESLHGRRNRLVLLSPGLFTSRAKKQETRVCRQAADRASVITEVFAPLAGERLFGIGQVWESDQQRAQTTIGSEISCWSLRRSGRLLIYRTWAGSPLVA